MLTGEQKAQRRVHINKLLRQKSRIREAFALDELKRECEQPIAMELCRMTNTLNDIQNLLTKEYADLWKQEPS